MGLLGLGPLPAYVREWESVEQYAEETLDDLGCVEAIEKALPHSMRPYVEIDHVSFVRDLELNGDLCFIRHSTGVWLFEP